MNIQNGPYKIKDIQSLRPFSMFYTSAQDVSPHKHTFRHVKFY